MQIFNKSNLHSIVKNGFWLSLCFIPITYLIPSRINIFNINLLVFFWMFNVDKKKLANVLSNKLFILFSTLYIIFILSSLLSNNFQNGFFQLEIKLGILIFPIIFATSKKLQKDQIITLFKVMVSSLAIILIVSQIIIIIKLKNDPYYEINYFYFYTNFLRELLIHPTYLSTYITFNILILLYSLLRNKPLLNKFLSLFLISFFMVVLFFLSSRINLIAFPVWVAITFLLARKEKITSRNIIYTLLFFILIGTAGFYYIIKENNPITYRFKENNYRFEIWKCSFDLIGNMNNIDLLKGYNLGDYNQKQIDCYAKKNLSTPYERKYNCHNQYLEIIIGQGVIGLIILLLNLAIPLRLSLKKRQYYYTIFIILIISTFLTESWLNTNKGIVFYSFYNSIFAFHFLE